MFVAINITNDYTNAQRRNRQHPSTCDPPPARSLEPRVGAATVQWSVPVTQTASIEGDPASQMTVITGGWPRPPRTGQPRHPAGRCRNTAVAGISQSCRRTELRDIWPGMWNNHETSPVCCGDREVARLCTPPHCTVVYSSDSCGGHCTWSPSHQLLLDTFIMKFWHQIMLSD